jgi:tetratricopeptide (TPR) repeat protein
MRTTRNVVINFLLQLEEKRWAHLPQLQSLRLALAERLVDVFQVFNGAESSDPDTQFDAAMAYMLVGNVYRVQGVESKALPAFQQAISLFESLVKQVPEEPLYQGELALAHSTLGVFLEDTQHSVEASEQFRDAVEHYRQAIRRHPNGRVLNNYAWFLATCPQASFRDPHNAVTLAKEAVAMGPDWGECWNTLGAAWYRAGDWGKAISALKTSMKLRGGGDGFDWYFLAMAYWQQGDKEEAQCWYRRAERELAKTNIYLDPIRRIQAEAAFHLGITDKPKRERKDTTRFIHSRKGSKAERLTRIKRVPQLAQVS